MEEVWDASTHTSSPKARSTSMGPEHAMTTCEKLAAMPMKMGRESVSGPEGTKDMTAVPR